jgi:uncharacterized protein YjbI with pentapeptide repeats
MANLEQLKILKQGAEVWNQWRETNPDEEINLNSANLGEADLIRTNLRKAKLQGTNFRMSNLNEADLGEADLGGADLTEANLCGASLNRARLGEAHLREAKLIKADLRAANLDGADLRKADLTKAKLSDAKLGGALTEANLSSAILWRADLSGAHFLGTNFSNAATAQTIFGGVDLSEAIGLDDVNHRGPSRISTDTLALSKGKISDVFLRGCGLSDWEIETSKLYNPELNNEGVNKILYKMYDLRASQALQIARLFISYSHGDGAFVDKIESYLNHKGIRFWRDVHDMKSGRMIKQINRAIELNPTVLLILSKHSLKSDWVEHEVRKARQLEKKLKRDVLCPVALDHSWKKSPWPEWLMEQVMEYNILDFSAWKDDDKFGNIFDRLIDGLELFYK